MKYSVLFLAAAISSCASNTGTGIITGTILGTSIGAMSGGGTGALIGSAAGIISGGLIGAALDEQDRKVMEHKSPRTVDRMDRNDPLTINDIIKLSQGGVSDGAIVDYIIQSQGYYRLSQAQIKRLRESGVSQRVINQMIASKG